MLDTADLIISSNKPEIKLIHRRQKRYPVLPAQAAGNSRASGHRKHNGIISLSLELFVAVFPLFLRNHKSNLCNDRNNKIHGLQCPL